MEFHRNYASSFLSHHANLANPEIREAEDKIKALLDWEIENLNRNLSETNNQDHKENLKRRIAEIQAQRTTLKCQLTNLKILLKPENPTIQAFRRKMRG